MIAPQARERDSMIVCRTSQGYEVRATPLRITRHVVAFEVYNPYSILQLSEVLKEFRIIVNDPVDLFRPGYGQQSGEYRNHAGLRGDA